VSAAVERAAVAAWLELVYGNVPGYVAAVAAPTFRGEFFATDDLDRAVDHLARKAAITNIYVGCCTLTAPPASGRGSADDTLAAAGVWADLDRLERGAHKWSDTPGRTLPLPNAQEVAAVLGDLGLAPTALIDSGHGFHAWWLFPEPVVFATAEDRERFAALSRRFGASLVELGRRRDRHVDDVSDLPRILRAPGTMNRKGTPVAVRLVECHPERRHTPADIDAVCMPPTAGTTAVRVPQRPVRVDGRYGESPADVFARIVPWSVVLEPVGFTLMREQGVTGYWHHPASTTGPRSVSATTDANGVPVLVVHSESAAAATGLPCGAGHRLTRFRTWAILNYRGDQAAAARALRDLARGVG
jgi:hypothetical protein